jgi:hypothetical protein
VAKRTFQYVQVVAAGTPQPVFGSTLTAAVTPNRNLRDDLTTVTVAASLWWNPGDYILIDPLGTNPETLGPIEGIPDATHVVVPGLRFPHPSGAFVQLSARCYSVFVQTRVGNSGLIYIGSSGLMNTTTGRYCIAALSPVTGTSLPTFLSDMVYGLANVESPSAYWMDGSTGDAVLPSLSVM